MLFVILIVTSFFVSETVCGQVPLTRKISFLEGLPSDVVYDLFVDKNGLLYLGTDKGLVTYNGVHFEEIGIEESLGNSISSLQQDDQGKIWCKNFANQLFYVSNAKLTEDQSVKSLLEKTNSNLVAFSLGFQSIYILTQNAVYKYSSGKTVLLFKKKNAEIDELTSIVFDTINKLLYVSSQQFIYTFKDDVLTKTQITTSGQKTLEIFKGNLSYSYKSVISNCVVANKKVALNNPELTKTFFNRLSATKDNLWLCTNNGIYEFDEKRNRFKTGFLDEIRVTDIVQDLEGNHWISSLDEGLFLLPSKQIFELKLDVKNKKEKVSYTRITQSKNGNYFVGTNDGRVLETTNRGRYMREYDTKWDNNIEFISFVGDTILTNYGFFKIGSAEPVSTLTYFGRELIEDKRGNLLIASPTFGGLIARNLVDSPNFKNPNNKFKTIDFGSDHIKTLVFRDKRAKTILYHSTEEKYYYGFIDGLFVYDKNGVEKEIKSDKNEPIIAVGILENSDGSIWVGTSQRGLYLIKNQKVINRISTENGLSDNNCRRIEKDSTGIWIITQSGFDYYDLTTKRVKNAQLNLCIKGITINDLTVYKNVVALATNQGIYYFNKSILNEENLPRFNFTSFNANNKKITPGNNVILKYDQNNINIKFNTIHYRSLGSYTYRYRLMGLDKKWYSLSSNAKNINFLALNPGNYKFQINIKIGEKYTAIKEINFQIHKPFWLRYSFLTVSVFALLALLYLVYRWAVIKTRKSEELKEQLALSQLTALRSQMNPHFIFNILNAVQGLIYSNQKSKASDYLGKFSDLMRRILDTSDKSEVTIDKEFETIDLYISLEKARFEDDFDYKMTFPEDIDLSQFTIPSMIIQPFVENAIKHGLMHKVGLKHLEIKLEMFEHTWCITIDDNGIGRKASETINQKVKKHISFATKAIDNRVKLINKTTNIIIDIEVIDKKAQDESSLGTRIKIYVPISSQ
ncbi:sensor histidine kinase [Flavobacterium sp. SM2513]|uniref:sensor histidine kinase n=1 Tax=Flavobacterium sp. SM2513 TaxID=3424766 RepID=UPI003D7F8C92